MSPHVTIEISRLPDLTVNQLVDRYSQVFGEECRSRNKRYLVRRIAWRLQANDEGGLTKAARQRAAQLAEDADVRITAPRSIKGKNAAVASRPQIDFADWDSRLPPPGNIVERQYKGQMVQVVVLKEGFEYEGQHYRSLTAIAKVVTGSHCNGFLFFKLGKQT